MSSSIKPWEGLLSSINAASQTIRFYSKAKTPKFSKKSQIQKIKRKILGLFAMRAHDDTNGTGKRALARRNFVCSPFRAPIWLRWIMAFWSQAFRKSRVSISRSNLGLWTKKKGAIRRISTSLTSSLLVATPGKYNEHDFWSFFYRNLALGS